MIWLPKINRRHKKKTLVFDMDETLIHCINNSDSPDTPYDLEIPMKFEEGYSILSKICIRPGAVEILK